MKQGRTTKCQKLVGGEKVQLSGNKKQGDNLSGIRDLKCVDIC